MPKTRILIVDDEADFTQTVKFYLEETRGYAVETINHASHTVSFARKFRPDIIFMDVIMPEMEGPDVVRLLRACEEVRETPVVFLTATVTEEEIAAGRGIIAGHRFLAKAGRIQELVNCIDETLFAVSQKLC
ncbi:MAG: response regulator [Candidatus Omnitrophota bacterium]